MRPELKKMIDSSKQLQSLFLSEAGSYVRRVTQLNKVEYQEAVNYVKSIKKIIRI